MEPPKLHSRILFPVLLASLLFHFTTPVQGEVPKRTKKSEAEVIEELRNDLRLLNINLNIDKISPELRQRLVQIRMTTEELDAQIRELEEQKNTEAGVLPLAALLSKSQLITADVIAGFANGFLINRALGIHKDRKNYARSVQVLYAFSDSKDEIRNFRSNLDRSKDEYLRFEHLRNQAPDRATRKIYQGKMDEERKKIAALSSEFQRSWAEHLRKIGNAEGTPGTIRGNLCASVYQAFGVTLWKGAIARGWVPAVGVGVAFGYGTTELFLRTGSLSTSGAELNEQKKKVDAEIERLRKLSSLNSSFLVIQCTEASALEAKKVTDKAISEVKEIASDTYKSGREVAIQKIRDSAKGLTSELHKQLGSDSGLTKNVVSPIEKFLYANRKAIAFHLHHNKLTDEAKGKNHLDLLRRELAFLNDESVIRDRVIERMVMYVHQHAEHSIRSGGMEFELTFEQIEKMPASEMAKIASDLIEGALASDRIKPESGEFLQETLKKNFVESLKR